MRLIPKGPATSLSDLLINHPAYALEIPVQVAVGKADYPQRIPFQFVGTLFVLLFCLILVVLRPVELDNQLCVVAAEVCNILSDALLPLKTSRVFSQEIIP